ncbi:MAG: alpha/beta fold hydrolase [Holophagales bacterium]|nr:alpha/beta fold hydrolase [Holophagales bacterium]
MTTALLFAIRIYLRTLAEAAPRMAGRQAYRLFSTPRRRRPVPEAAEGVMARAERLELRLDGKRLAAYRWPVDGRPAAGRVMLVHGWESRAARLAAWVEPLLGEGLEVVAFDAPAHGDSEGHRSDPRAFVEAMVALVERAGPVSAIVAHSLGGLSSLLAVGGGGLLGHRELEIERLVVLGGAESGSDAMGMFCRVLGLGERFLPLVLGAAAEAAGHPVADFDGNRIFADRPLPTLWLHDPEDSEVPIEAAERVARSCPHVRLERVSGLGHHRIARDPEMIRRGIAFLASEERRAEMEVRPRARSGRQIPLPAALAVT